jgi:hypothetical protein
MSKTPGRAGLAVAAVTGLTASFLTGMVVAGGFGTTAAPPTGPPDPNQPTGTQLRLVNADLTAPGSCEALLESYVERGVERVGPYGWDSPIYFEGDAAMSGDAAGEARDLAAAPAAPAAPGVVEQGSSDTGTNVQEVGVDEPDVVKTDGELLVRVDDGDLLVHDVTGAAPVELSDTDLPPDVQSPELLLAGNTVVVIGHDGDEWSADGDVTHVVTYDLSDPGAPALVDHRSYDTGLVRAVQHDDDVRLVLSAGLPDLDFVQPRWWRGDDGALERNRDVVRRSKIEDWLPGVTTYDAAGEPTGTGQLLDCADVAVPSAEEAALGTMAVVGFDADDPGDPDVLGVATDTRLAYFSATRMYLATSGWDWGCCWAEAGRGLPPTGEDTGRTRIYGFELDGTRASYVASGVVDGVVPDRWAMDEHDGVLRVALGPSAATGNFNSVVTLREDGDELEEIGRVDKLGVDEQIKSVRWFDGLAIVVTFRQVDPLYAVDLTDPGAPELLGALKIPGFSEYLHPISGQRLIGMGQDATLQGQLRGAQAALFDVADLTDPRQTDLVRYRKGSVVAAASDPRQFTWLPGRETALAVVSDGWQGRTGWVSVLTVDGAELSNRMVEVAYGDDVDAVRLVPLPDGRVVLLSGGEVSFLDL